MCPLVNPAALFSFRLPCQRRKRLWPPAGWDLDETCQLPPLAALTNVPDLLELWLAWNESGLAVRGKAHGIGLVRWCQPTRPEDSDGLHLWIATRPTGESHRAGRYCRRLALLPTGGGLRADQPIAVAIKCDAHVGLRPLDRTLQRRGMSRSHCCNAVPHSAGRTRTAPTTCIMKVGAPWATPKPFHQQCCAVPVMNRHKWFLHEHSRRSSPSYWWSSARRHRRHQMRLTEADL